MIAQFYGGGFVFYDRFIELCRSKSVKPTPLVLKMGLSSSNVSQWKKGSTPRPEVLQKFSEYFNVSVEYLLTGEEQKESPPPSGEPLDPVTRELMEFVETASEDERRAALEMVKLIKKQRRTQNG